MAKRHFVSIPAEDTLGDRSNWTKIGRNEYACVRNHIMIVESRSKERKNGPAFSSVTMPVGVTLTDQKKRIRTVKSTEQITRALESTVTTKLLSEVVSSFNNSTTVKASGLEVNFGASVSAKVGAEFVESLREAVTGTTTYEITETEEVSQEIEATVPTDTPLYRKVTKHVVLRPVHWDIYLVRADVLVLKWHRTWYWARLRETVRTASICSVQALCRIVFYTPEPDYGIHYDAYVAEVDEDCLVSLEPLSGKLPRVRTRDVTDLIIYAKRAFPTTAERAAQRLRRRSKSANNDNNRARGARNAALEKLASGANKVASIAERRSRSS